MHQRAVLVVYVRNIAFNSKCFVSTILGKGMNAEIMREFIDGVEAIPASERVSIYAFCNLKIVPLSYCIFSHFRKN